MKPSYKSKSTIPRPQSQRSSDMPDTKTLEYNLMEKINNAFDSKSLRALDSFDDDTFNSTSSSQFTNQTGDEKPTHIRKKTDNQREVLSRAKELIKKNKSEIPLKKKYHVSVPKENTFVTGINMYAEQQEIEQKEPPPEENEDDEDDENYQIDENEMLKNLIIEESNNDDLAELRKMINKCKRNISDYASDVYRLNGCVSELNVEFKEMGKGVHEDVIWENERKLEVEMPNGDKNHIFTYQNNHKLPQIKKKRNEELSSISNTLPPKSIKKQGSIQYSKPSGKSLSVTSSVQRLEPISKKY